MASLNAKQCARNHKPATNHKEKKMKASTALFVIAFIGCIALAMAIDAYLDDKQMDLARAQAEEYVTSNTGQKPVFPGLVLPCNQGYGSGACADRKFLVEVPIMNKRKDGVEVRSIWAGGKLAPTPATETRKPTTPQ